MVYPTARPERSLAVLDQDAPRIGRADSGYETRVRADRPLSCRDLRDVRSVCRRRSFEHERQAWLAEDHLDDEAFGNNCSHLASASNSAEVEHEPCARPVPSAEITRSHFLYVAAYMNRLRQAAPAGSNWNTNYGTVFDASIGPYNSTPKFVQAFEVYRVHYFYLDYA